jgi:hypothetical protein
MTASLTRRGLLLSALAAPALLAGCDRLGAAPSFRNLVLTSGERLSYRIHRAIGGGALAREYEPAQMSPEFRTNGNTRPMTDVYAAHEAEGFATWRLAVGGPCGEAARVRPDRPARQARAHPDHPARLRGGLVRHRPVDGGAAGAPPGRGRAPA